MSLIIVKIIANSFGRESLSIYKITSKLIIRNLSNIRRSISVLPKHVLRPVKITNMPTTSFFHKQNLKENDEAFSEKKGLFKELVQSKVLTVPNVLTVSRILMTPVLGHMVVTESYMPALLLFIIAGFTDLLDGLIARNFKSQISPLGSFLDPLADKLLVSTLFATLGYVDLIPVYLMGLVILRDVLLMSAGFYVRYTSLNPRPKTLKAFFDPTNHAVKLQPTNLSKFNTAVQLCLVATTLASPVFDYVDHQLLHGLWYLTAVSTVMSGIGYIFARNTIKYVPKTFSKKL